MSVKEQVGAHLSKAGASTAAVAKANLTAAKQEIKTMLSTAKSSVCELCVSMEREKNRTEVKQAFKEFNAVVTILLEAALVEHHDTLMRDSLCFFKLSKRLR